jgi:AAA+ ATPase superfamily predicted ATPase
MNDFVGRDQQLARLASELDAVRVPSAAPGRLLAVRGRRQVGKSTLVERFIAGSDVASVFFVASRQSAERELDLFTEAVAETSLRVAATAREGGLTSWEAALSLLAAEATPERPLVLVFDEFPYLMQSVPAIEGVLQKLWDRALQRSNVLTILVGSDLRMMRALSEYGQPLYGRVREMVVPPLSPAAIAEMLSLPPADAIDAYLATGGFPRLATLWRPGDDLGALLGRELADPTTPLAVLGERTLAAELPPEMNARLVLEAIGSGERAYAAIAQRAGVAQTSLNRALDALLAKGIIARGTPYSSRARASAPRYWVADPYLRFWLRFIGPSLALMERGRGDLVRDRILARWSDFRGRSVETVVRAAVERMLPDERFGDAMFVGGYWTRDGRVEIDLVGGATEGRTERVAFVGSVKWRDSAPFDRDDFAALVAGRERVPGADTGTLLVGVSRTGFIGSGLDVELGPADLLEAWRHAPEPGD